jgi:hypothetical protein
MAWGAKAPEIGPEKVGWMQDSDLNVFCRLKSVFIWANGEEAWDSLRLKVFQKLPAEELPVVDSSMEGSGAQARKALEIMTPLEVYERSLFSVKCDSF